ncbi:MAG: hypothetical protein LC135_05460 [Phycisphaerae bacterium]|jgi:hypothetical protein|nr:hypothetical protein [Phycisphaerae bacterium]MCZ2399302.1 hypothetical protein [Phycisphaerae bacterium]NUQ48542.1 hypothetical protein [Phycisphaerae bacterium]
MAEGRQRDEWSRTSVLLALLANAHRDPKKTAAFRPRDFDPFARREPLLKADVTVLKDVFIDRKMPGYGGPGGFE